MRAHQPLTATPERRPRTTSSAEPIVVVGAGIAAVTAADELRRLGFDGGIVLIGDEPELPYDRPPLSKGFLRGDAGRADLALRESSFYDERRIVLHTGTRATGVELGTSTVVLDDGRRIRFSRLVLATGAEAAPPPFAGAELDGVHVVRTLEHCERLRTDLAAAEHLLVIGGGWLGAEIAASARQLGHSVTLAVRDEAPLAGALGSELGAVYAALHEEHGTDVLARADVVALESDGRVRRARTADGRTIDADLVVFAGGARARTDLAAAAGLPVGWGVVVDAVLRTPADNVFAAGDAADVPNAFYGARIPSQHWDGAIGHGEAVAAALLGTARPYDRLPHIFSDQYDSLLAYHGSHHGAPSAVRGGRETGEIVAFWQDEALRVVAAAELNLAGGHGRAHGTPHGDEPAPAQQPSHGAAARHEGGDAPSHEHRHDAPAAAADQALEAPGGHAHLHGRYPEILQSLIRARAPIASARLADPSVPLEELSR